MTKDKKESDSLEKAHRDLVSNRPSSLVKRALDDLARLKAHPLSGPEQSHSIDLQKKRQIRVVIVTIYNHLKDLLVGWVTDVLNDKYDLTIKWVSSGEELLEIAEDEADIFIAIGYGGKSEQQLITQIKKVSDKPVIVFSSWEDQPGGDFDFFFYNSLRDEIPDNIDDDFKMAFEKCLKRDSYENP